MDKNERTLFMKALGSSVREYVQGMDERIRAWVKDELKVLADSIKLPEAIEGTPGRDGIDGKDAIPVDIKSLKSEVLLDLRQWQNETTCKIVDEIAFKIADLPKAKDGIDGKDGASIHPDTLRLMIINQVNEIVAKIPVPKDGRDGYPGRDALELDVLPTIDFQKSYPRGTFAQYRGGLIRAVRNTDPTKSFFDSGWVTLVEGIDSIFVDRSCDLRTFAIKLNRTSGAEIVYEFAMPTLIYRGIFRAGEVYKQGDCVTKDGSTWHCNVETTSTAPADDTKDWQMIVRSGRNGKDAASITKTFDPVVRLK